MNSFGWRFAPLVFGTLLVLVTIRLVRRVSRSTLIGGLAGLLLTFDGLAFVMSRTALLDIFLAFFVVAAVELPGRRPGLVPQPAGRPPGAARAGRPRRPVRTGAAGLRPWRLAAGLCFGLAIGTKWNALYLLAAFALLSLAWDVGARRLAGAGRPAPTRRAARRHARVRLAGRAGRGGLRRHLGRLARPPRAATTATGARTTPTPGRPRCFGETLASWVHYQKDIWNFHTGDFINNAEHSYRARPGRLAGDRPADRHRRGQRHQAGHRRLRRPRTTASG